MVFGRFEVAVSCYIEKMQYLMRVVAYALAYVNRIHPTKFAVGFCPTIFWTIIECVRVPLINFLLN